MNNFLAKFKPDTKVTVGISVSPNVGLELIQIDPSTNKIVKYARRDLPYNSSIREIEDYTEFKQNLQDLFNEVYRLSNLDEGDSVTVLIGPEGDFSEDEIKLAMNNGYESVSLGTSRLRTETAALSATMLAQLALRK